MVAPLASRCYYWNCALRSRRRLHWENSSAPYGGPPTLVTISQTSCMHLCCKYVGINSWCTGYFLLSDLSCTPTARGLVDTQSPGAQSWRFTFHRSGTWGPAFLTISQVTLVLWVQLCSRAFHLGWGRQGRQGFLPCVQTFPFLSSQSPLLSILLQGLQTPSNHHPLLEF